MQDLMDGLACREQMEKLELVDKNGICCSNGAKYGRYFVIPEGNLMFTKREQDGNS